VSARPEAAAAADAAADAGTALMGLTAEFQAGVAGIVAGPWSMAVGLDSAYDHSTGSEVVPGWVRWCQAGYNAGLARVLQRDTEVRGEDER
jgi:hypothetical protein